MSLANASLEARTADSDNAFPLVKPDRVAGLHDEADLDVALPDAEAAGVDVIAQQSAAHLQRRFRVDSRAISRSWRNAAAM